jgi:ubiquinol-cytochrome c reductase iron-sulfur subunit
VSRIRDWLIASFVLLAGRGRAQNPDDDRMVPRGTPSSRAESVLLLLFALTTLAAVAFIVVYALDRLPNKTQYLGLAIGLAFVLLAVACYVIARWLIVTEELSKPYPEFGRPEEQEQLMQLVEESGSRFTRRRLLLLAGSSAVGALSVAAIVPAVSMGPLLEINPLYRTPWFRGRRLVDEAGNPYLASDVEEGAFYTAFPHGADRDQIGAPLVLVRLAEKEIRARRDWAPLGIVAYSKVCTHAGCAISLYRKPTYAPTQPKPAFVCPCHYSTFDPANAGAVIFGPAGRALPQLPLLIDRSGHLRAAGNFSGPLGPSWWGVRNRSARP